MPLSFQTRDDAVAALDRQGFARRGQHWRKRQGRERLIATIQPSGRTVTLIIWSH